MKELETKREREGEKKKKKERENLELIGVLKNSMGEFFIYFRKSWIVIIILEKFWLLENYL